MKMPAFVARLVFGQMGEELVLSSTRVVPTVLMKKNYQFLAPGLEESLRYCLQELQAAKSK
jgi:NAD dependent epimerase/dehydratase family enzyme